ncbi:MAG: GntR family transcriptional regulator [Christensenella sp.]|nr:GntR family transcriptional regulator [Christensenella sp.]
MNILISNASNQPIYEQIYTQIKNAIIAGDLEEGDALPSIRQLAKDLRISVITTKRAYEELERDGFIDTVAAKGCFVAAKNIEMLREEKLREIEEHMREILRLAPACGLSDLDVLEQFRVIVEEEQHR